MALWYRIEGHCSVDPHLHGLARLLYAIQMGVSQNQGYLFGGPYNKDCIFGGSILGSPYSGKLPNFAQVHAKMCTQQAQTLADATQAYAVEPEAKAPTFFKQGECIDVLGREWSMLG